MTASHETAPRSARPRGGIPRLKQGSIPFLSYGFRPFFLGGAVWAVFAMVLWIGLMSGRWSFASGYGVVAWHTHELLLGYGAAVMTGFLLTAIPNWTGRLPVQGGGLLVLFLIWIAGRVGFLVSDWIGSDSAAAIDSVFLFALAGVILREIIVGRNWRNLKVALLVAVLGFANVIFHVEVLVNGVPDYGLRLALASIVAMIMLVGGRITPSFTRNWLVRQGSAKLPASFGRFDVASLAIAVAALVAWIVAPKSGFAALMLLAAAAVQALRLGRWAGLRTWREPLVLILHAGYAFVPLGFVAVAGSILWPGVLSASDALHAWTVGAIGVMTLAVMTRATLGHSGRALTATAATCIIYLAIVFAALTRIGAALLPAFALSTLMVSAIAWILAFATFAFTYGPLLVGPRRDN